MTTSFEWSREAFGGTEYMASNFRELIAPELPKLENYLCLVVPGIVPHFTDIHKSDKQVIMWIHNTPAQFADAHLDSLRNPKFLAKIKNFITPSEFAKQEVVSQLNIDPDLVYVIPNAIEPLKFEPSKFDNPKQIKLVHTSSPDRGVDVLINSLNFIDADFKLEIYNNFYPELTPGFPKNFDKRVRFYGKTPKATVLEAVENSHIHAYPSTYPETFCISQAEGMSAGLACVTSDSGALPEITGGHGYMYPYIEDRMKHAEVFAKNLTKAIDDIRNGNYDPTAQVEHVNSNYSWEAVKQKWIEYHETI